MGEEKERQYQTDHDLLVRLHERFGNFEKLIISSMESLNSRIGQIMSDVDSKVSYKEFVETRDKHRTQAEELKSKIDFLEKEHIILNTKKDVYIGITSWTWKNWAQIIAGISILSFIVNSILSQ